MKIRILAALIVASAIAAPAFANTDAPLTRAQVHAELVQLRQAGYRNVDETTYPTGLQAAERKVAEENGSDGFGGVAAGSSAAGVRTAHPDNGGARPVQSGQ